MTKRVAIGLLLALNLIAGGYRYLHPAVPKDGLLLWDLRGNVSALAACDAREVEHSDQSACRRAPPFLPAAFPLARWLNARSWSTTTLIWFLVVVPCLFLAFAREANALRDDSSGPAGRTAAAVVLLSLVAFKGTSLGVAAGQPSVVVTLLLYAFVLFENAAKRPLRMLAMACLALASTKPNIAAPFFLYLLLRRDFRAVATAATMTVALQLASSFATLGPLSHLRLLLDGPSTIDTIAINSPSLLGASGRVDLAPLLSTLGIEGWLRSGLQLVCCVGAMAWLASLAPRLGARLLLLDVNLVCFAFLYHRDYDVPLLLLLALPLLWQQRRHFGLAACALALPAVLPLQAIHTAGVEVLPAAVPLWNLIGSSMAVAVLGVGAWLNLCCLRQRPRLATT